MNRLYKKTERTKVITDVVKAVGLAQQKQLALDCRDVWFAPESLNGVAYPIRFRLSIIVEKCKIFAGCLACSYVASRRRPAIFTKRNHADPSTTEFARECRRTPVFRAVVDDDDLVIVILVCEHRAQAPSRVFQ